MPALDRAPGLTGRPTSRLADLAPPRLGFAPWWLGAGLVLVATVIYLSVMHDPPQIPGDRDSWLGHMLAYGSMMGWFARLYAAARLRRRFALAFCAMGVALEFVQAGTSYRTFDVHDMLANATGVLLGWVASPPRFPDGIREIDRWLQRRFRERS